MGRSKHSRRRFHLRAPLLSTRQMTAECLNLAWPPLSPSCRAPFLRPSLHTSQPNKHYSPQAAAGGGRAESRPPLDALLTQDRELGGGGGRQLHFSKAQGRSQGSRNFSVPTSLSMKPLTRSPQHTPERREESSPPRPDPAGPAAPSWSVPKVAMLPGSLPGR